MNKYSTNNFIVVTNGNKVLRFFVIQDKETQYYVSKTDTVRS